MAGLCLAIWLLWEGAFFIPVRTIGITLDAQAENGVEFFQKNHLRGPIFNNFDVGSYLIYKLYPQEKVFIDGRPEAYPASFFQNIYIPMQQDPTIFATENKKFHFQTIFYAHTDATPWGQTFFKQIMKNKDWKLIYLDDAVAIFVRENTYSNFPEITQNSFSLENIHTTDPAGLTSLAYFFDSIGWQQIELQILQRVLSQNEAYCPALQQLTQVFLTQQNTDMASIYGGRFNAACH